MHTKHVPNAWATNKQTDRQRKTIYMSEGNIKEISSQK